MLLIRYRSFVIALLFIVVGAASVALVTANANGPIDAFELRMALVESELRIEPLEDPEWSVTCVLSENSPGPFYVFEGELDSLEENIPSVGYCFAVEWSEGAVEFTSIRGTVWLGLGYSCGESQACEFVVTEQGVSGR
jgi:hypothetical protein